MSLSRFALVTALLIVPMSVPARGNSCHMVSCLKAQDINGVRLDMTVQQVAAIAPAGLEAIGGGQYNTNIAGVAYNLEFTPLGHLFRIDSSQPLGYFEPDQAFGLALVAKLSAKYGIPQSVQLPAGPIQWGFTEPALTDGGIEHLVLTESFSALLMPEYQKPVSLHLKLMDFRILRRDRAAMNVDPEKAAEARVHF